MINGLKVFEVVAVELAKQGSSDKEVEVRDFLEVLLLVIIIREG